MACACLALLVILLLDSWVVNQGAEEASLQLLKVHQSSISSPSSLQCHSAGLREFLTIFSSLHPGQVSCLHIPALNIVWKKDEYMAMFGVRQLKKTKQNKKPV